MVLGAGGSVGHAFHVGVLSALADELGWDARSADLIVGTSAGSVVGAGLRAGLGPLDMRARALGQPLSPAGRRIVQTGEEALASVQSADQADAGAGVQGEAGAGAEDGVGVENRADDGAPAADGPFDGVLELATRMRQMRMASPERVLRALREPWRVTPGSLFSAMVPPGRRPTGYLGAPYDALFGTAWPASSLWIVAVELDVGTRVVFGRDDLDATVGQAVQASCAVPGYFAPVTVDGARFVDGGVHSTTNADLAAHLIDVARAHPASADPVEPAAPDLVIVIAPMSPERPGTEWSPRAAVRQMARRWLAGEVLGLRNRGVEAVTFQPNADDLAQMSGNTMDPSKAPAVIEQAYASTIVRLRDPDIADRLAILSR